MAREALCKPQNRPILTLYTEHRKSPVWSLQILLPGQKHQNHVPVCRCPSFLSVPTSSSWPSLVPEQTRTVFRSSLGPASVVQISSLSVWSILSSESSSLVIFFLLSSLWLSLLAYLSSLWWKWDKVKESWCTFGLVTDVSCPCWLSWTKKCKWQKYSLKINVLSLTSQLQASKTDVYVKF